MFKFKTIAKMKLVSRIGIGITAFAISILLFVSYYAENVGHFTIDLSQDLFEKNMVLSETIYFTEPESSLTAAPLENVEPIGIRGEPAEIPVEISSRLNQFGAGSNNGQYFLAYTFYARNDGTQPLSYNVTLYVADAKRNVDAAVRVLVITEQDINGEKVETKEIYAKAQGPNGDYPGEAESGAYKFLEDKIVFTRDRFDFNVGTIDKYTVVMWVHGEDKDCTNVGENSIEGGKIQLSMKFYILNG